MAIVCSNKNSVASLHTDYDEIQNNAFSQEEEQKMKFVCVKGFIQTKRGIIEIFKQMRAGYDERTFNCKRPKLTIYPKLCCTPVLYYCGP